MFLLAVLYAIASAVLFASGLNALWLAWRHRRQGGMQPSPSVPAPASWPAVTVQLPLYNEQYVVERLLDAAARLDYPGPLEIQVLDDSTDETRTLTESRVAHWRAQGVAMSIVSRPMRDGYKAGALAHGLGSACGRYVAVFDADFVPPADFLRRTVPLLEADQGLGLVQARWGHLNATASVLTRVQAMLLDTHFVVEQDVRSQTGLFMNFNGTAGLWRRACIEDAGGWHSDTLTEDLDLSYRAQLAGWRLRFVGDLEVAAEIPETAAAWRQQQHRWAKGTTETACKLARALWRAPLPLACKVQGVFHLGGFVVYPALLIVALLYAPLLVAQASGVGPGELFFAVLGLGLIPLGGVLLAHASSQRALYTDWGARFCYEPVLLAASIGIVASNAFGVMQALAGRRTPFTRTPKMGQEAHAGYRCQPDRFVVWTERMLVVYSAVGLGALVGSGVWIGVGFQGLILLGFGFVGFYDYQARHPR